MGLALVAQDGLRMGDPEAIAGVGVDPDRRGLAPRIIARQEDAPVGLQAHHVGGSEIRSPPGGADRMAMHERQDDAASLRQAPLNAGTQSSQSKDQGARHREGLPAGIAGGEVPKGRPVAPRTSFSQEPEKAIVDQARDRHRHAQIFGRSEQQSNVFRSELGGEGGRIEVPLREQLAVSTADRGAAHRCSE